MLLFHLALYNKIGLTRPAGHRFSTQRMGDFRPFFWKSRPGVNHSENYRFRPIFFCDNSHFVFFWASPTVCSVFFVIFPGSPPQKWHRFCLTSWTLLAIFGVFNRDLPGLPATSVAHWKTIDFWPFFWKSCPGVNHSENYRFCPIFCYLTLWTLLDIFYVFHPDLPALPTISFGLGKLSIFGRFFENRVRE